jgi:hypothetical protein
MSLPRIERAAKDVSPAESDALQAIADTLGVPVSD